MALDNTRLPATWRLTEWSEANLQEGAAIFGRTVCFEEIPKLGVRSSGAERHSNQPARHDQTPARNLVRQLSTPFRNWPSSRKAGKAVLEGYSCHALYQGALDFPKTITPNLISEDWSAPHDCEEKEDQVWL